MDLFWLAVAGGTGTVLRHGANLAASAVLGGSWPWATLFVNVVGSFGLGVAAESLVGVRLAGTDLRLTVGVGLLGGFTTYSAFNLEVLRMLQEQLYGRAAAYTLGTLVFGLAAGAAGVAIGRLR